MTYDIIIVGGGLAGCSLAKAMSDAGVRTLVLERETRYRDRVRGEGMHPWGVAEARTLGIYDPLIDSCGHEVQWWYDHGENGTVRVRDLLATTPHGAGSLNYHHPEMQEVLLQTARAAGAEIIRGATVTRIAPGVRPSVEAMVDGKNVTYTARIVAGADGRSAKSRQWGDFTVHHGPEGRMVASVLLENVPLTEDGVHIKWDFNGGQMVIVFPIGRQRFRVYLGYPLDGQRRGFSGDGRLQGFIQACIAAGTPASWYVHASPVGPLAEYSGAIVWAETPYKNGIVLVGDAAGSLDPSWGCGQAQALRDVRLLSQFLTAEDDWGSAARAYADAHAEEFATMVRIEQWFSMLLHEVGDEADARRQRVFSRQRENIPDVLALGPDSPSDEAARRRFFAED